MAVTEEIVWLEQNVDIECTLAAEEQSNPTASGRSQVL
jgi:hypothetical protein